MEIVVAAGTNRELYSSGSQDVSSKPRLILGSGRSGTTWVLDCLAEANGLRPIFEPLHPMESDVAATFAYEILTQQDTAVSLERYFSEIAAGRVHSRWIDYRAPKGLVFPHPRQFTSIESTLRWFSGVRKYRKRRHKYAESTRREEVLIKCIRANLMASWFSKKLRYPTVLIVRHPCSVVESQFRLGKAWDPTSVTARYRENDRLHEITGGRYLSLLMDKMTTVEALTLNWIIENQWPVEQSASGGYSIKFYEDLVGDNRAEWESLCVSLGLSAVPTSDLLRKPSQQAATKLPHQGNDVSRPRWKLGLTIDQLKAIQRILDATGCAFYNVECAQPVKGQVSDQILR